MFSCEVAHRVNARARKSLPTYGKRGANAAGARQKAVQVIEKLRGLRLTTAAQLVEGAVEETLAYYALWKIPEVISTLRVFDGALGMYLSIFDKYCFPTLQISSSSGTDLLLSELSVPSTLVIFGRYL